MKSFAFEEPKKIPLLIRSFLLIILLNILSSIYKNYLKISLAVYNLIDYKIKVN